MSGHVKEREEASEQCECAGHVEDGEVLGLFYLLLHVLGGGGQLVLQGGDLALLGGQLEGDGLSLEEEKGCGDGEEGDGAVVEEAVDAAC